MRKILAVVMFLFIALLACASYKPIPAPVPMQTFETLPGEVIHGYFNIEDGSGPEGMTIIVEPNVLTITSRVISPIADFPKARRYTYYFDYTGGENPQLVIIKSYDNRKREVVNSIMFNVTEDDLHVFTECGEITEPNEPVSGIWWNRMQDKMRDNARSNLVWEYNRVVEGKQGLSWRYETLQDLENEIAKYDDPREVVMQGHLVEN